MAFQPADPVGTLIELAHDLERQGNLPGALAAYRRALAAAPPGSGPAWELPSIVRDLEARLAAPPGPPGPPYPPPPFQPQPPAYQPGPQYPPAPPPYQLAQSYQSAPPAYQPGPPYQPPPGYPAPPYQPAPPYPPSLPPATQAPGRRGVSCIWIAAPIVLLLLALGVAGGVVLLRPAADATATPYIPADSATPLPVFADTPAADTGPRKWTVQGTPVLALTALDAAMQNFMQSTNTRAGTLAVSKNGRLLFAHAYTWAASGYPLTQPSSLFRLASVTKAFTAAAIAHAYATHLLTPDTPVYPLLGITTAALPDQQPDPRVNTITVQQLVDHAGGWDDTAAGSGYDPVYHMRDIAIALNLPGPPSERDLGRYMYGEPLQFAPGARMQYSNFGYLLLGLVIEQVSRMPFVDYLKTQVLAPLGITDVYQSHTLQSERLPREVTYDQSGTGLDPLQPNAAVPVPLAYGGDGWLTEDTDSVGGLAATATAVTQLIHTYAVWGLGPRASDPGSWSWARSGSMAGTSSWAESRSDGLDYAYIFNTRDFPADSLTELDKTLDKIFDATPLPADTP